MLRICVSNITFLLQFHHFTMLVKYLRRFGRISRFRAESKRQNGSFTESGDVRDDCFCSRARKRGYHVVIFRCTLYVQRHAETNNTQLSWKDVGTRSTHVRTGGCCFSCNQVVSRARYGMPANPCGRCRGVHVILVGMSKTFFRVLPQTPETPKL